MVRSSVECVILNFIRDYPWSLALSKLKGKLKGFVWYLDAKGKDCKYS